MPDAAAVPDGDRSLPEIIADSARIVKEYWEKNSSQSLDFYFLDSACGNEPLDALLSVHAGADADQRIMRAARFLELIFNPDKKAEAMAAFEGTEFAARIDPPPLSAKDRELGNVFQRKPLAECEYAFIFERINSEQFDRVSLISDGQEIFGLEGHQAMVRKCMECFCKRLFPDMPPPNSWEDLGKGHCVYLRWTVPLGPRSLRSV